MEDNGYVSSESTPKKKKKGRAGKIVAIVLLCAIIGALCAVGGASLWEKYSPVLTKEGMSSILNSSIGKKTADEAAGEAATAEIAEAGAEAEAEATVELEAAVPAEPEAEADVKPVEERVIIAAPAASSVPGKAAASEGSPADIYEDNVSSTVGITIKGQAMTYYGITTYEGAGSGFIISSDGYILTNYHVIEDSSEVSVETFDGSVYDAEVIGYDESNDIAVLKIDAENLKPVVIGDSGSLRVGDTVLAIGNPLGKLSFSLTQGIVSALSRNISLDSGASMSLIQTDCAINSGNSGGALFNMNGEVIGITNAKYSSSGYSGEASIDNIGFAIPINTVKNIYTSIIENGYISKPYLGITIKAVSEDMMNATGLEYGVYVASVTEDSPAAKGGLLEKDIILSADGEAIETAVQLTDIVTASEPGTVLELEIYRQGKELTLNVEVGEQTSPALPEPEETPAPEQAENPGAYKNPQDNYNGYGDFFDHFYGNGQDGYDYYGYGDGGSGGYSMEDFFNYFFNNMF